MKPICASLITMFFCFLSCTSTKIIPRDTGTGSPTNIILMIGDGMGLSHVSGLTYEEDGSIFESFNSIGFQKTHAADQLITDSASSATSMATGAKTYKRAIGVGMDTLPLRNIMDVSQDQGLGTGIVTSASLVHATPASFYAHQETRALTEFIAIDLIHSGVDIFIGGGKQYFNEGRSDGISLVPRLEAQNYTVYDYTTMRLNALPVSRGERIIYFVDLTEPNLKLLGHYYLADATNKAIRFLESKPKNGYFLVVEGAQIDWAAHANLSDRLIQRLKSFEEAVRMVLEYAVEDGNTLVVVTADHETGGVTIGEKSKMKRVQLEFSTKDHTASIVPVFAYGPGSAAFKGLYDNTEIFHKLSRAMGTWTQPDTLLNQKIETGRSGF